MDIAQKLLLSSYLAAMLLYYGYTVKAVFVLAHTWTEKIVLTIGITIMFSIVFYLYYMMALSL